jgi:hypothetical protein
MTYKVYVDFEVETQGQAHMLAAAVHELLPAAAEELGVTYENLDVMVTKDEEEENVQGKPSTYNFYYDGPKDVEAVVKHLATLYDTVRRNRA